ncbi:MAG: hypothetical protein LBO08_02770 [Rickettsiales bacterium]|jgi:hypothetical protein|nr:hypothetical protein [Rickettsiales bacterium]
MPKYNSISRIMYDSENNCLVRQTPDGPVPISGASISGDTVVDFSAPGANPWYRKYKSGWVEQGARTNSYTQPGFNYFIFPVEMADANYSVMAGRDAGAGTPNDYTAYNMLCEQKTTTQFTLFGGGTRGSATNNSLPADGVCYVVRGWGKQS